MAVSSDPHPAGYDDDVRDLPRPGHAGFADSPDNRYRSYGTLIFAEKGARSRKLFLSSMYEAFDPAWLREKRIKKILCLMDADSEAEGVGDHFPRAGLRLSCWNDRGSSPGPVRKGDSDSRPDVATVLQANKVEWFCGVEYKDMCTC